jgi:hypothetical protein
VLDNCNPSGRIGKIIQPKLQEGVAVLVFSLGGAS